MNTNKGLKDKIESNFFSNFIIDNQQISEFKIIKLSSPTIVNTRFRFNTIQETGDNGLTNEFIKVQLEQF
jgi:hypothetical protein